MKIDLGGQVLSQAALDPSTKQTSASNSTATVSSVSEDRATLSSAGTSVSSLVGQALSSPAVRQDKVDSLRQSVSSGEYQLDPHKIASAIISEGGR